VILSSAIISSGLGFLSAVLGLIVSQRYQRWLECRTLASAILTEALDILDTLQLHQEILDGLKPEETLPKITVGIDDMQVFLSNTGKLGLFEAGSLSYILKFYSRVRRIAAGTPTRDLIGVIPKSSLSGVDALQKEISDAITAGHAVVNFLERQVPKERLSATTGANIDIWGFRKRAEERREKETAKLRLPKGV
jgi:hypothetical protein